MTSRAEARALAITAQGFAARPAKVTRTQLRTLVERLGVIQIDSVNALSRSHYLPAFSRLGAYDRAELDALAWEAPRSLFEYWGHEASLLPVALQPLLRFRMEAAANEAWGRMRTIAKTRKAFVADVLAVVHDQGPIAAGAIEVAEAKKKKTKGGWWSWSDTKTAIEFLFWSGQVTSAKRRSFERLYDLTERVLPAEILAMKTPSRDEAHRALIERSARAMAIGSEADLRDYYRLAVAPARAAIAELVEAGMLIATTVEGWPKPGYLHRDAKAGVIDRARGALLSPFDNLIWMRDRTERMFGMKFRLEIYTPAPKRLHGYYVLPFLLGDELVARVDLKADRKSGTLLVHAAHYEKQSVKKPAVAIALAAELRALATWLGLAQVSVAKAGDLGAALGKSVRAL